MIYVFWGNDFYHDVNFLTQHLKGLNNCLAPSGRQEGLLGISGRCPELFCICLSGNI
jgi:hypothetical protein